MNKLVFFLLLSPCLLNAQAVALKIGGATFINCKSVVAFGEQSVVSLRQNADGSFLLNAEVYNEGGQLVASVYDNLTTSKGVIITQNSHEILLTDKYTGRKICQFATVKSADGKRTEVAGTLNLYLPNGRFLQCTPEASNQAVLETMRGTTVSNKVAALLL